MKTWIYSWIIYPIAFSVARLIGLFSHKVRDTLRLRAWQDFLSLRFNAGQPIEYWIHVASAGELEYAIPLFEELSRRQKKALVTYYSISAKAPVEVLPQKYACVSLVVPLPHDGLGLMRGFVRLARQQGVRQLLLLKYELWPGLLSECNAQGVRVVLVDALRPSWFHKRLIHKLDGILAGYDFEVDGINHRFIKVVGDTRVERVLARISSDKGRLSSVLNSVLMTRLTELPVLICGSMWPADTKILSLALAEFKYNGGSCHVVWVPHELNAQAAENAHELFREMGFDVQLITDETASIDAARLSGGPLAVIVMRKGILVELYRLGQAAYVGGGFGSGVHSVWEPALAGLPVACGPRTERSPESKELALKHILTEIHSDGEAYVWLKEKLITKIDSAVWIENQLSDLVARHTGAAHRIVEICERI